MAKMIYIIAAIGFIVDLLFIVHDDVKHDALSIVLKTVASLSFVIMAFYLSYLKDFSFSSKMILLALIFDLLGDFILILRNIDTKHKDLIFIIGTLCFFVGHIFLMIMLFNNNSNVLLPSLIIASIIYLFVSIFTLRKLDANKAILIIGYIYVFFIIFLLGYSFASLLNAQTAFDNAFVFGYFLFVVSDIILTIQKFGNKNIHSLQAIYRLSYFISQILIALSIMYL